MRHLIWSYRTLFVLVGSILMQSCQYENSTNTGIVSKDQVQKNSAAELEYINTLLKSNPSHVELLSIRSKLYFEKGLYALSLEDVNKVLEIVGADCKMLTMKIKCLFRLERKEEAISFGELNDETICDDFEFNFWRGVLHYEKNELNKASDFFNKSIVQNPYQSETYLFRGLVYAKMRDTALALRNFELTIQNDSSNIHAYECLLDIYSVKNDAANMEKWLALAKSKNRNLSSSEIWYHQANWWLKKSEKDSVKSCLAEVLNLNPNHPGAHQYLGRDAFEKRDYSNAEAHLQRAIRNGAKNDLNKFMLATVYLELNRVALADTLVSSLIAVDSLNSDYLKLKRSIECKKIQLYGRQ